MSFLGVRTETNPESTSVISPVRREDSLEGGHEVDVTAVFDREGESFELLGALNETNFLSPLDGCSSDFDGTFEGVLGFVTNLVAHCCKQAVC